MCGFDSCKVTNNFHFFLESTSRAAYSVVSCRILPKFERMQAFMYAIIIFKCYKNRIINSREKNEKSFCHYKSTFKPRLFQRSINTHI